MERALTPEETKLKEAALRATGAAGPLTAFLHWANHLNVLASALREEAQHWYEVAATWERAHAPPPPLSDDPGALRLQEEVSVTIHRKKA